MLEAEILDDYILTDDSVQVMTMGVCIFSGREKKITGGLEVKGL